MRILGALSATIALLMSTGAGGAVRLSIRKPAVIEPKVLQSLLPEGLPLDYVVGSADARYSGADFIPLLGLDGLLPAENGASLIPLITQGLARIAKQERFTDIVMQIHQSEARGCVLTLHAITGLVIERITVSGALIGKERYRQRYPLHPGELFDAERDAAGIAKIEALLHDEGYWGAQVASLQKVHREECTVEVALQIALGKRYSVCEVAVTGGGPLSKRSRDEQRIFQMIRRTLEQALLYYGYDKQLLDREVQQIRQLLIDRGYLAATIQLHERTNHEHQTVALTFSVSLGSKNIFSFHGNRHFSRKELLAQIILFGTSTTLIPPSLLADELQALYRKRGFWHTQIVWQEDGEHTFFFITEGARSSLRKITLEGAVQLDAEHLIRLFGKGVTRARYFSETEVTKFYAAVLHEYHEQGFWDAVLQPPLYTPLQHDEYEMRVAVHEGARRWLVAVECDESCPLSAEEAQSLVCREKVPFNPQVLQEQRAVIVRALRAQGRVYAQPTPLLVNLGEHQIKVRWQCAAATAMVVRVGKSIIQGNGRVADALIERELLFSEGDVWNAQALAQSTLRLKSCGIFETVSLVPDDVTRPESQKSVIVHCVPDAMHELRMRAGVQGVNRNIIQWNGGASPKVGLSYIAKNPAKMGDHFRIDFDYARYMHDVAVTYKVPWIGGKRVGAELQCVSARYDQPLYIGSPQVLYRTSYDGCTVSVGRTYGILSGGMSGTVVRMGLDATPCRACQETICHRTELVARALRVDPILFKIHPWYALFEITGMCDTRDDKVNPHAGSLSLVALQGIVPPRLSGGSALKLLFEHAAFIATSSTATGIVLGLRLRVGAICGAAFEKILPPERFYIGGSHSVRSYEADYAPPLNTFTTCDSVRCVIPTGGKYMMNGNVELRFPIYKQLGGVLFCDAGMLSGELLPVTVLPHTMMGALGAGLRVNTAIGPLRFDIGWKVARDCTVTGLPVHDRRYAWFITLGHAF